MKPPSFEYQRWREDGSPAAGTFEGWPKTLKEFTFLDPCCGSGHFLFNAFNLLVPLRMHEEGLSAQDACAAVLRDNLFGLELDPRCTQIAAFALALAAWKYPGEDGQPLGYRALPAVNLACTGIGPQASEEEWLEPAERAFRQAGKPDLRWSILAREPVLNGMRHLHALFSDAPNLGSLIDPNQLSPDLITADYETLKPYLVAALAAEKGDDEARERAVAAAGMVKAAELLAKDYTLVATNVPYLGRSKQHDALRRYCEKYHANAKADLATCFVDRCLAFCAAGGTGALVTPQNWLFLPSYKKLRERLLTHVSLSLLAELGAGAFETISGAIVKASLLIVTQSLPLGGARLLAIDVSDEKTATDKARRLRSGKLLSSIQADHLSNPDARVLLEAQNNQEVLGQYADSYYGQGTGDRARFVKCFWEVQLEAAWECLQGAVDRTALYSGHEQVVYWEQGRGALASLAESLRQIENHSGIRPTRGAEAWGKNGIAVSLIGDLPATLYNGYIFDGNCAALIPKNHSHIEAVWAYCSSDHFREEVRALDKALKVMNWTLLKVPFDLVHWQKVAAERYPNGLPKPYSNDLTQWLFDGHPAGSDDPLQVGVARLLGYRWPRQTGSSFPDCPALGPDGLEPFADTEGIVCIPAVRGEPPATERLLELLHAAYGKNWSDAALHDLLTGAGGKAGTNLDDWLRNTFFEQHCKRFHNRPFIWHIGDGRKDGFSCLVNYHKLNHKTLENLTYAYLGDWITAEAAETKAGKTGADLRLGAAQALQEKLKLILAGEPPYDIFVRWKPLSEQAIGWNPDLNDGVRMNIRPFVEAGILRKTPNIKWTKDRGKEPERDKDEYPWFWDGDTFKGDRVNDVHLTNAEKQATRDRMKAEGGQP